jgi:hypothetical protein
MAALRDSQCGTSARQLLLVAVLLSAAVQLQHK